MVETSSLLSIVVADSWPMEVEDKDLDKEPLLLCIKELGLCIAVAKFVLVLDSSEEDALVDRLVTGEFRSIREYISTVPVIVAADSRQVRRTPLAD